MLNHLTSRDLKLPKEYLVQDEYLMPTGDLTVTILDIAGTVVNQHIISPQNQMYMVPSTSFGLADMELAKPLFIQISFTIEAMDYQVMQPIRVIRFRPITIQPSDIRSQLGASVEEMPDSGFDIYGSYLELCDKVGADIFSSPAKLLKANRLLLLHILIKELPTLSLRLLNSRSVDDHKFTRNKINVDEIGNQLKSEYELLLTSEFSVVSELIEEPLLTIVQRSDPYTGA